MRQPKRSSFLTNVQQRTARVAVGPSTARGQRASGLIKAARQYLSKMSLRQFGVKDERLLRSRLDRETNKLQSVLPPAGRSFGLAICAGGGKVFYGVRSGDLKTYTDFSGSPAATCVRGNLVTCY